MSTAAPAGPQGGDVVYLKNGGLVRGTLVDSVPDRPVRIQLVTGEIWSIDRSYIDHVVPAGSPAGPAPQASPTPTSPGPAAPPVPVPSGPMVRLHVESPRDLEIVGHPSDATQWIPMCTGSCDKPVPASWEYQARGAGMRASSPFALKTAPGGTATVRVDPGDKSAFTWGIVGVCAGGVVGFIGFVVTAIGASGHITQTVNGVTTTQPVSPSTLPTGIAILGVGGLALVVGGIVALDNASTTVTQGPARSAQASPQPQHVADVAVEMPRVPDVATATLFDVRF